MKDHLVQVPIDLRQQPDNFHDRTGHCLKPENSKVYKMIQKTEDYAEEYKMKINYEKTKLMIFNPGTSRDFMPRFRFNGKELDIVEETKLLGIIIN